MSDSGNKHRSRSPMRKDYRKRKHDFQDAQRENNMNNAMNQQMMFNNMFAQGNMMMATGMFPNMMMGNPMMPGPLIPPNGMDMMPGTNMELMPSNSIDMTPMGAPNDAAIPGPPIDMNMMGGPIMDPSMMGMYPNMNPNIPMQKENGEIVLKDCKLIPPRPGAVQRPLRPRPRYCRSLFVGGLPDRIKESTIRDIFERYGAIVRLRFSRKNFCHIRFEHESSLEAAVTINGYGIILTDGKNPDGDNEASHNIKYLNIDYAMSRDDRNEYELGQKQIGGHRSESQDSERSFHHQESRHSRKPERYLSPPKQIQPFSTIALVQLAEKIKNEAFFSETLPTLTSWLERGECNRKNVTQFYSMLQTANSHIRRLMNEKMQAEDEFNDIREKIKERVENVVNQLEQVAKVFAVSMHQRVWDHFTKPQRKNIESWVKMTQFFNNLREEYMEKFCPEEIDTDKTEDSSREIEQLKQQNQSLQFQLEAYRNEIDIVKQESQGEIEKFKAQFIARNALLGVVDPKLSGPPLPPPPFPPALCTDVKDTKLNNDGKNDVIGEDAKLIGIMSAFLQVHPMGASLDYVVSYVQSVMATASQADVHRVLQRHTDVFRQSTSGVGANIDKRWTFIALDMHRD